MAHFDFELKFTFGRQRWNVTETVNIYRGIVGRGIAYRGET